MTIRGKTGLTRKPILRYIGTATSPYFFKVDGSQKVVLENLEFDGNGVPYGAVVKGKYVLRLENGDTLKTMRIYMRDCIGHDFSDKFIRPYAQSGIDSIVVQNCVFYNGDKEALVFYTGTTGETIVIRYGEVSNCTIYNMGNEAIAGKDYAPGKIRINHVTIYNVGETGKKPAITFRNYRDVEFKNSIIVKNHNTDLGEAYADFGLSSNIFKNIVTWDVYNNKIANATFSDTLLRDPQFANPNSGDFTLPVGSPLLTFADDGLAVGDLRWVPQPVGPKVWEVAAGTDVLAPAIAAADTGDIIELVTDGGEYLNSSLLEIGKNLTIRGKAGLATKPVIKYTGTSSSGYFFKITNNPRVFIQNLDLNGDGRSAGASYLVKNGIYLANADTTGKIRLYLDNCLIHDVAEKGLKTEKNSGVDSLVVTNCIFYNAGSEGVTLYSGTAADPAAAVRRAIFRNNTFHTIEREAIKSQTSFTRVLIDRCTFFDIGRVERKQVVYFSANATVEMKNCIIAKNHNLDTNEPFVQFTDANSTFHHNAIWDVYNWNIKNATFSDTIHVDPLFVDTAGRNFRIQNSLLLTYADDGGPVGDQRWVPSGKVLLTIKIVGQGRVTLNPPGGIYDPGTVVTMTAIPADLWAFDGWSPNVLAFPPKNPVANITINENTSVTAYFIPTVIQRQVTVSSIGLGHVELIEKEKFPAEGYFDGDTLVLTAQADTATWEFAYWTNVNRDSLTDVNPLTWVVNRDSNFTAYFRSKLPQVSVTVSIDGLGKVTVTPPPVPGFTTYDAGTTIRLDAEPFLGWQFSEWSGDLTGINPIQDVVLNANLVAVAHFTEIAVPNGELLVDANWDLRDALKFAQNNSQVKVIKLISAGPYMPKEEWRDGSGKLPQLDIRSSITIVGAETLAVKPVIKGWGEGGSEGLFRLRENGRINLKHLEVDGNYAPGKVTKYIFRLDDAKEINVGVKAEDVDFHGAAEVFLKFYALVHADTISLTNCRIWDIGKEGIFDNGVGICDNLLVENCTFHHIGREVVRTKIQTPKTRINHVTVANCGYGYTTEGAKFGAFKFEVANDLQITNTIIANVTNPTYNYSVRFYGPAASIDNCILWNTPRIDDNAGGKIGPDVFWVDPLFVNPAQDDYTLRDSSVAYHLANDGTKAIGDLRWATSTNIAKYYSLKLEQEGPGKILAQPAPIAKFYLPGTVVTLTALADTLYKFSNWSGDLTGAVNPANLTMDTSKLVVAHFTKAHYLVELNVNMSYWAKLGKFRVGVDSVDAAGTFNGWQGGAWLRDLDGDTIYTTAVKIDEKYPHFAWKFRINGSWNDATAEFPYGGPDRVFTATKDTSLFFWYNDEMPSVGISAETFPTHYELCQNYPNPFNPSTSIRFSLKESGHTTLIIYDLLGKEVARLVDRELPAGYHEVTFSNQHLPSGIYFYKLTANRFTAFKKMMLLK